VSCLCSLKYYIDSYIILLRVSCFKIYTIGEKAHCISSVNVSDYTEDFEDSSSLAKWSSLDLLAEGEDTTVRTPSAANEQG
jgi:hypothetical protein